MTNSELKNTILIVDDTLRNVQVLGTILKQEGYQIMVAQNGFQALKVVEKAPPDLILLDIMMPEMDGFETCRCLKENRATRDIPVIFMTALSDTEDKVKGLEIGAIDYITKPIQQREVLARIATHLTLRNLQKIIEQQSVATEKQKLSVEQKANQLQQRYVQIEAFVQSVVHDLKRTLAAQVGFTKVLKTALDKPPLNTAALKYLQEIEQCRERMTFSLEDLSLFMQVQLQEIDIEAPDMAPLLRDIRLELAGLIKAYQGEIIMPTTWPSVWGYSPWVKKAWLTYITNGIKYGGKPPRLELGATPQDGYVRFWVHDNGPGLSIEQQRQLFVPITEMHSLRVEDGYGMELSLVKLLIERCRGQVGVESQPGKGSTFYFTLPAIG